VGGSAAHMLDGLVTSATLATQQPSPGEVRKGRSRTGKRKHPIKRAQHNDCQSLPRRSWWNFASFALVVSLFFTLAAGVGAVHGTFWHNDLVRVSSNVVATGGVILQHGGGPSISLFRVRPSVGLDPWDRTDPHDYNEWRTGGHAVAMTSVGSFTPEGNSADAATSGMRRIRRAVGDGGTARVSHPNRGLRCRRLCAIESTHCAFAYSMEELPGYHGAQGPSRWN
jgi:hypothetical protein